MVILKVILVTNNLSWFLDGVTTPDWSSVVLVGHEGVLVPLGPVDDETCNLVSKNSW